VNYPHFLNERLKFAIYLYDATVPQFEEIKRKIEADEPPYQSYRHPEDDNSDPPFLEEWEQADLAADALGMACLGHIQIAFHLFLKEFTAHAFRPDALKMVSQMKQGSWFGNFRAFYATATDREFDWKNSGVDLKFLEEVILTRNNSQHPDDLLSPYTIQDEKHRETHPDSSFRHPTWSANFPRLFVSREKLVAATEAVSKLAKYLDDALLSARWGKGRQERKAADG